MKISNYTRIQRLMHAMEQAEIAYKSIETELNKDRPETDGSMNTSRKPWYSFHLKEYNDGSGFSVDLTGVGCTLDILKFTQDSLKKRIQSIKQELETL